jgi:hypothetical protein
MDDIKKLRALRQKLPRQFGFRLVLHATFKEQDETISSEEIMDLNPEYFEKQLDSIYEKLKTSLLNEITKI